MLALALIADLTGVTDLRPNDTEENPYFYTFKVQCTSCREVHPNWVSFSRLDKASLSGSKGEANFVWRCKNCKREASANITEAAKSYTESSPPKQGNVIFLDCRGLEFTQFKADGAWLATGSEKATPFEGIDLEDGDWYDYDEKAASEVSIKDVKWSIRRA